MFRARTPFTSRGQPSYLVGVVPNQAIGYSKEGLTRNYGERRGGAGRGVGSTKSPPHLSPDQWKSFCRSHCRFRPLLGISYPIEAGSLRSLQFAKSRTDRRYSSLEGPSSPSRLQQGARPGFYSFEIDSTLLSNSTSFSFIPSQYVHIVRDCWIRTLSPLFSDCLRAGTRSSLRSPSAGPTSALSPTTPAGIPVSEQRQLQ